MKAILFLSIMLCMFVTCSNAAAPAIAAGFKTPVQANPVSIMRSKSISAPHYRDDCHHYKSVRNTGIVLTSLGGASLAGGIAMIVIGVQDIQAFDATNQNGAGDPGTVLGGIGLVAGGSLLTIAGTVLTGVGIPLIVKGVVKGKKACNESRSYYIELSKSGTGLACRF